MGKRTGPATALSEPEAKPAAAPPAQACNLMVQVFAAAARALRRERKDLEPAAAAAAETDTAIAVLTRHTAPSSVKNDKGPAPRQAVDDRTRGAAAATRAEPMTDSTPAPLPLTPSTRTTEVFAAAAHALCRKRGNLEDATPAAVETDTAIAVLARHAPASETQRRGVRLARRIIEDVAAGRRGPANLSGTGKQRPSLSDFVVAVTDNDPFTCRDLIDRLAPYVRLNPKRTSAAHNINGAVNADSRFRRHERGVYTRIHHG